MYFNKLNRIIKPLEALEFKMQKNYKNGLFVLKYSQAWLTIAKVLQVKYSRNILKYIKEKLLLFTLSYSAFD